MSLPPLWHHDGTIGGWGLGVERGGGGRGSVEKGRGSVERGRELNDFCSILKNTSTTKIMCAQIKYENKSTLPAFNNEKQSMAMTIIIILEYMYEGPSPNVTDKQS